MENEMPAHAWVEALDRASKDLAEGRTVPAAHVHALLSESIGRMRAAGAAETEDAPAAAK